MNFLSLFPISYGSNQKKTLQHFGHRPERGGGLSTEANLFIEFKYGHVIGGGGGGERVVGGPCPK